MTRLMTRHRRRADDRGVALLIFIGSLVLLIVLVAFAVDLGFARFDRRDEQSAADLAALDAGYYLAAQGPNTSPVSEPRKACIAAVQSVLSNIPAFAPGYPTSSITSACSALPQTASGCAPNSPVDVTIAQGQYTLVVRYPVVDGDLTVTRFGGPGTQDGSAPCERMQVRVAKQGNTAFAAAVGTKHLRTQASATVRGTSSTGAKAAPAVLLLERTDCGVFGNSVNGNGNLGIIVEATAQDPGLIHADSNGTTNCSGTTSSAFVLYGSPLSSGAPSIAVGDVAGPPAKLGIIRTAATNGRAAATFPGGLSTAPVPGEIVSRIVVDQKYNSASNPAITNLHAAAAAKAMPTTAPAGYVTVACGGPTGPATAGQTRLYVNCPAYNASTVFSGYTDVVFSGNIDLKQGNVLRFPDATNVVVRGELAIPGGIVLMPSVRDLTVGAGVSVSNGSGLAVNSPTETSCDGREGPAWTATTNLVVFGGDPAFASSGTVALCQTHVYLAGPKTSTYAIQQVTSGGTCSPTRPCPKTVSNPTDGARFFVGGGTVRWSAPNQYAGSVPEGTPQGLEDLALWSEGSGTSEIKSGGTLLATGVFFAPSATYEIRSPATGQPRDAQFVARKAFLFQGTLRVQPQKSNSVTIPVPGSYILIR